MLYGMVKSGQIDPKGGQMMVMMVSKWSIVPARIIYLNFGQNYSVTLGKFYTIFGFKAAQNAY